MPNMLDITVALVVRLVVGDDAHCVDALAAGLRATSPPCCSLKTSCCNLLVDLHCRWALYSKSRMPLSASGSHLRNIQRLLG